MRWSFRELEDLPLAVYDVLVEQLVQESEHRDRER